MSGTDRRWICCQIGAREHYAVPRALHQKRRLAGLYTDVWSSLAGRYHPELARARVEAWNAWAAFQRAKQKAESGKRKLNAGRYLQFVDEGRQFASRVREALKRRKDLSAETVLFAYDTGALEALEWCKEQGITCILDQMDPNRVEVETVREEEKRWPGWASSPLHVPEEYFQRREREWELADRVVVNSEFCRQALIQQGVPESKLVVIPLCFEKDRGPETTDQGPGTEDQVRGPRSSVLGPQSPVPSPRSQVPGPRSMVPGPLKVLFLGQVILRKGIQYLMQAARILEGENIQFDVVGPVGISPEAVASAPKNMIFHGRVNRAQASDWYRQADVFVLPTISDGFALTQLEAMAHGLPVIATPCCGEVMTDHLDGFIVPPRDPDSLASCLHHYLCEPGQLQDHSQAALQKSQQFTLARLAENLLALERNLEQKPIDYDLRPGT